MTLPAPGSGPSLQIPDLVGTGAQAIVENANRLGLTWTMSLATVTSVEPVVVIMDGDTAPITVVSMVSTLLYIGDHAYVIRVPPSGNFLVGIANGSPRTSVPGANTLISGLVATSAGSEVEIPSASYLAEPTYTFEPGLVFRAMFQAAYHTSSGADTSTVVRIRQGQATTVGAQLCFWVIFISAFASSIVESNFQVGYFKNSRNNAVATKLTITNDLAVGTDSSLFGDSSVPLTLQIDILGRLSDHPELDAICPTV